MDHQPDEVAELESLIWAVQVRVVKGEEVAWFDQQLADHHYMRADCPVRGIT
jgi:hypothetical protein